MTDVATPTTTEAHVAELYAKQQITEVLTRRARAGDRKDVDLALSCYHEGAVEMHEGFAGSAAEFIRDRSMISPNSTAPVTFLWHFISNVLVDLHGDPYDSADVESYHIALVGRDAGDGETHSTIGGRYLDRFALREGRWGITERSVVFDWSRVDPATTTYWDLVGLDPATLMRGRFGTDDPVYGFLDHRDPAT